MIQKKVSLTNVNQKDNGLPDKLMKKGNESSQNETKSVSNKETQDIVNCFQEDTSSKFDTINRKKKAKKRENKYKENNSNTDEENSSIENQEESSDLVSSSEEVESLGQRQMRRNKIIKKIIIKKAESEDIISLDEAKELLFKKDYESLIKVKFPYLSQCDFNSEIFKTDLRIFRKLLFFCPICSKGFRNYSMPYHIFQNHFDQIEAYLTEKEIARCCAKIMKMEKEKIESSLDIFSDLALLYNRCKLGRSSQWRDIAEESIKEIKTLNIEKNYFNKSQKEIMNNLTRILPINKNKNEKRKYIGNKRK